MDDVFQFRNQLVDRYSNFSRSFVRIAADDIQQEVERQYQDGRYWPEPLVQINPNYQRKGTVQSLAAEGVLHPVCADVFQVGKPEGNPQPLHLYAHQLQALAKGQAGQSYVVTTGTGSGKSSVASTTTTRPSSTCSHSSTANFCFWTRRRAKAGALNTRKSCSHVQPSPSR